MKELRDLNDSPVLVRFEGQGGAELQIGRGGHAEQRAQLLPCLRLQHRAVCERNPEM